MRKIIGRGFLGAGAVVVGVLLACGAGTGCAVDATPSSTDSLPEGLTILSADPAVGVSTAFKQNGRVIYLQTRVGPQKEKVYLEAFPKDPDHEIDARVVDMEGHTFQLVIGGDKLIDPTWSSDILGAKQITTPAEGAQRQADFALARTAAAAFAAQAPATLKDHIYHLTNMTARVPLEDARLSAPPTLEHPVDITYAVNGCGTNGQEAELFTTPLGSGEVGSILGDIAQYISGAEHSTTWGWNYNYCAGGVWDENIVACNHGPCANSGITYACESQSGYPSGSAYWTVSGNDLASYWLFEPNTSLSISTSGSTDGLGIGCFSPYGITLPVLGTVYGYGGCGDNPGNHVCNDDSSRELDQVRNVRRDSSSWSGGQGGWNGSFTCNLQESCPWYTLGLSVTTTDGTAPSCP